MSDPLPVITTLTKRQQLFRDYYLASFNATDAAEKAGYKHPNKQGPELLKQPQIAAAIKEKMNEVAMSANEVLMRLSEQARHEHAPYIKVQTKIDGSKLPYVDVEAMIADGKQRLIQGIKYGQYGASIEFPDGQAALTTLARIRGLFGAKGTEDDPLHAVGMTLDEWRAEVAKRRADAAATEAMYSDDAQD